MVALFDPASQVTASSLAQQLSFSGAGQEVLAKGGNVRRCLDELLERGLPADALALVARTLPKRYVVAWACDCFKNTLAGGVGGSEVNRAGLALAQQWLADPSEENRRAAMDFAEQGELRSPGAWIAASAGWTGGSLAPRGYDPIPPPDHLPAEAAVAALRLLASATPAYAATVNSFISRALQIFGPPAQVGKAAPGGRA